MKNVRLFTLPAAEMHLMRTSSPIRRFLVGLLTALITLIASPFSVQAATVTVPPGLAPGSSYRLIFVTSGTRDAQSTNIADYNAFATAQATAVPALAALGTTWTAVVSTASPTVEARDNTGTNPATTGVPFYGLNGLRLAANNTVLWDGTTLAPGTPLENVITDSNGTALPGVVVWTGTTFNGTGPFGPLGFNGAAVGNANSTSNWISNAGFGVNFTNLNPFYAMSGVLVVPDYLVTTTGNAIVVTDLSGNGDTLIVSEPSAGNIKFAAAGRYFSVNGGSALSGDSGDLSLASMTSITVNGQGGNDTINVGAFTAELNGLTLNGGTGNDAVNMNGSITFAVDTSLDADLSNDDASPGTDSIAVATGASLITSGTGTITLKGSGAVSMAFASSVETVNGAIAITSTASGISLNGATVTTSGTGNVSLAGTGIGDGGGISISSSDIRSLGTGLAANQGLLTLNGTGSGFGTGIALISASAVMSFEGAISMTGTGNGGSNGRTSKGIIVSASGVESMGTATVYLNGKGNSVNFASDTNAQHHGIEISGFSAGIMSAGGKITLDGDARFGRSSNNFGVVIQNGAGVTGTGAAEVEIIGITRIASGIGSNGNGIVITGTGSRVTTVNGPLKLTGTGSDQASSKGVLITTGGQVASTAGDITITGSYVGGGTATGSGILYDSATAIATSGTINLVSGTGIGARMILSNGSISGTAGVTVKAGAGVPIDLGSTTDAASSAELSDTELDMIATSGTLAIGDANSGAITLSAAISRSASTTMALTSASNILFSLGTIHTGGGAGALTLTSGAFGSVQPITSGTDVTTSASTAVAFGAGSKLGIVIAGVVEDTDYSPLNVAGLVNLTGVTLVPSGAYVPAASDSFVLIKNDGSDLVTGTFSGLAEGAIVSVNGVNKALTYLGGSGNDVVLLPLLPTVTSSTATLASNATTITITGTNFDTTPGNNTVVFSNGAVGTVTAATDTSLTVTFSTAPTSLGNLTAVVTTSNGTSGAPVQVATVSNIIATLSGGALTITDVANGNDTLSISESAGDLVITANGGSVIGSNAGAGSGTNSVSIPLSSITGLITVNAAGGTDIINVGAFTTTLNGLTLNGGTGNDTVSLNGGITFAANANLDVDLQNDDASPGIDNVAVGNNARIATSGTGTITVKVSQDITTAVGSSLTTASGNLTLEAAGDITTNGALVADAGNIVVLADSDASGSGNFVSTSPVPALPTGAVLHYTMNETPATNGVTLTDSSGSGNSSTVFRAAGDGAVAGKFGGALSFPGGTTTEYAIANPVSGAWPTTALTVSAWVKPSNAGYFFSYAVPGTDNEILFSANDIWVNGNALTITPSIGPILSDGQFHHVAMTWNSVGGALVVYVDGVQKFAGTITPGSPISGGGILVLGQDQDSLGGGFVDWQAFGGLMDEVAVFNRALSPAEVATLATPATIRTGAGSVDLAAVDVVVNAAITSDGGVTVTNTGTATTISGVISGAGGLTKLGAGTLDLIAANTFAGDTTIDAGTIRLRSLIQNGSFESPALAAGDAVYYNFMTGAQQTAFGWTSTGNAPYAVAVQANNAAWGYQSAPDGRQALSLQRDSTISQVVNFPAPGNYTLAWNAASRGGGINPSQILLDGINVYSWQTGNTAWTSFSTVITVPTAGSHIITFAGLVASPDLSVGIDDVTLGASGSLPSTTAVTLTASGAVLDLNGIPQTLGSIAGVSGTSITLGNGNLTTGGDGTSTEFAGVISGAGNFVKAGGGTLNLSGANTFTGTTTINAGALRVNGSLADGLAATDVIVNSTGTLDGSGTINGVTQVNSGGSVAPGAGLGILNTKNVAFSSGSTFSVEIGGATVGTGYDQLNGSGNVTLGGATLSLASFGGYVPLTTDSYLIVNRTGGTGTFAGLAEGALISNFLGSGLTARITYLGGSGNDVVISMANPEIQIEQPLTNILVDGTASVDFGTKNVAETSSLTFTVKNIGSSDLNLGAMTFNGSNPGDFTIIAAPTSPVTAAGSTTFVVAFKPLQAGPRTAVMHIANDDVDENPFDITLTGTGTNIMGSLFDGTTPVVTIPPSGSFVATGLNFETDLGFIPTPGTTYTFIDIVGPLPAGIIGKFNDLPDGGVVAMAFNGVIYYFQANYTGGVGGNDLTLTNFTPASPPAWRWTAGPKTRNNAASFGTINVAAGTNNPGARQGAMIWRGADGSLWMFGGYGYAGAVTNPPRYLNDLWQYDRTLGQWIWRSGSTTQNVTGVYGSITVEAAGNTPGARHTGTTWTDGSGNLWLFGGLSLTGRHNDLWRFNRTTSQWAWMKGSSSTGQPGDYTNADLSLRTPGARQGAASWFTSDGSLWLFGGFTGTAMHNDLWRFSIATGNWTWVAGSSSANANGTYGTQGTPDVANIPGARRDASSWVANDGTLWLFGGLGRPATGATNGDMNDLWRFNPVTNEWTWMKGSNALAGAATYGVKGTPAAANTPGARSAGSGWVTVDGKFWLVGGFQNSNLSFSDVWIYDSLTNNWVWMQGANTTGTVGVYGTLGVAAPGNQPGARFTPSTWVTLNGALWIFGGGGVDAFGSTGRLSDLWSHSIPMPAGAPPLPAPEPFSSEFLVNEDPNASDATAGTMAYVPVAGQLSGTDADHDLILFSSVGSTQSQGTLSLQANGQWVYTPAPGFIGQATFSFKASDYYGGASPVRTLIITVVTNPADADNDGLPDTYEQTQLGGTAADALGDADADGQSNYFEYLAGTSPVDAAESLSTAPSVSAGASSAGGSFKLEINHVRPGVNYHLETSSDLDVWSRIGTFTFNESGSVTLEDPTPPTGQPQFYRISLEATTLLP